MVGFELGHAHFSAGALVPMPTEVAVLGHAPPDGGISADWGCDLKESSGKVQESSGNFQKSSGMF
jgi:hypothetical protein